MKNFSVDKIFAEDVFTDAEMEKRISKEAYESYRKTVDENVPLKRAAADEIFGDCDRVKLIEPLEVFDFHNFQNRAHIIPVSYTHLRAHET